MKPKLAWAGAAVAGFLLAMTAVTTFVVPRAETALADGAVPHPELAASAPGGDIGALAFPSTNTSIYFTGGPHFGRPAACDNPVDPATNDGRIQAGVDFDIGDSRVRAMKTGTVSFVGQLGAFGWVVVIDNWDAPAGQQSGWSILYAHLAQPGVGGAPSVSVGQRVSAGDQIGVQSNTGCVGCGEHLHVHFLWQGRSYFPDGVNIGGYQFWPAHVADNDEHDTWIYPYEGTATRGTTAAVRGSFSCSTSGTSHAAILVSGSVETVSPTGLLIGGGGGGDGSGSPPGSSAVVYDTEGSSAWESFAPGESRNLTTLDNKVSFIVTPSGIELVCSTEPNMVAGNISRWGPGSHNLTGTGHDNQISSCRAEVLGTSAGVTIYDGPGRTGESHMLPVGWSGNLDSIGFDNRICSLYVPDSDVEFRTTEGRDRSGNPANFGGGRTWDFTGTSYCDSISWGEVVRHDPKPTVAIVTRPAECVAPGSLAFAWSGTNATEYSYRFDGSEWTETSSTAAAVSASGTRSHMFELKALGPGGESDIVSYAFQSDGTPPTVHPIKLTGSRDANQIFRSDLDSEISVTDEGCGGVATADVRGLEFDWQPVSEQLVLRGSGPRVLFVRAVDGIGNAVLVKTEPFLMSQAIISQVEGPLSVSGRTTLTGPIDVPSIKVCKTTSTTITGPVYVQDPTKTELCSNTGLSLGPIIASAEPFPLIRYDPELLCALADVVYNGNKSLAPTGTTYDNKIICVRGTLTWYGTNIRGNVLVVVVGGDFRYYGTGDVISSADAAADRTGLVVFTTGMAKFSGCTGASISGHIIALNGISGLGTNCHFSGSLHSDRGTAISGTGSTLRYDPVIASSTYEIPIAAITDDELRELLEGNAAGEASPTPAGTPTATPSPTPTSTPTPSPTASPTPTFTPSPTPTPSATSATVVSAGGFELRIDAASMTVRSGRTADFTGRLSTASGISCLASVTVQGLPSTFTVFQDLAGLSSNDWETFSILLWPSSSTSLGTFPANVVAKCGATELRLAITVTVVP